MTDERIQRRLAAILAADVAGYSRLMEQDEAATLAALKSRRKSVVEPLVARHQGRIFKIAGDSVLVEFGSAVNAVQCAVELQQDMAAANEGLPEDRRILLRIGVNLGDVMVEGSDLYGDGVNVAARLEALIEPGGICVSAAVRDQVLQRLPIMFEDLGEQGLKNLARPIRIFRVSGTPSVSPAESATHNSARPSIAVLPFDNMSGDSGQQYFSDGVTEDIITELSRFRELFVIARNSSFQFRGGATDVKRTGRALGADYLVEGSVRRAGGRVRVTAQLVEVASGNHVWAERYDRNLEDVFAVQDEVVATIVTTLMRRLAAGSAERARRKPPQMWAAYDYFLQGREQMHRFDVEAAAPLLRQAIELDPTYSHAHGWLASAHYILYSAHGHSEDLEEGLRTARKAVALDPLDSRNHSALAMMYSLMRQYELAGMHYDRAVALNPNDVASSALRGLWLVYVGRGEEGLRSLDEDLRRDPFPPAWYWDCRGIALFQLRRYAEAIEAFQQMSLLHWWSRCYIAACHAHLGRDEAARREVAEVLRLKPDFSVRDVERSEYWRDRADLDHLMDGLRRAGLRV